MARHEPCHHRCALPGAKNLPFQPSRSFHTRLAHLPFSTHPSPDALSSAFALLCVSRSQDNAPKAHCLKKHGKAHRQEFLQDLGYREFRKLDPPLALPPSLRFTARSKTLPSNSCSFHSRLAHIPLSAHAGHSSDHAIRSGQRVSQAIGCC